MRSPDSCTAVDPRGGCTMSGIDWRIPPSILSDHRRPRRRRRDLRAAQRQPEGQRRAPRRLGEGLVLQAAQVPGRGRSRGAVRCVAHDRQRADAVPHDQRDSGNATPGGDRAPAPGEGPSGKARAPHSHRRRADRRGRLRGCLVLDARRGDPRGRHAVPVRGSRAHRRGSLRGLASTAKEGRATRAATRASRCQDRRGARTARQALREASAVAQPRRWRAHVAHRDHPSRATPLLALRRGTLRAAREARRRFDARRHRRRRRRGQDERGRRAARPLLLERPEPRGGES